MREQNFSLYLAKQSLNFDCKYYIKVQFILEDKSPWNWLGIILDMETTYKVHSNVDFSKQPWL